jgi:hypothetical protein
VSRRNKPAVRVIVRYAPDLARQVQALLRLLGPIEPGPEKQQPQDPVEPGAAPAATAAGGHNRVSEYNNDSGYLSKSK